MMALELRPDCERCGAALAHDADAVICSYELPERVARVLIDERASA